MAALQKQARAHTAAMEAAHICKYIHTFPDLLHSTRSTELILLNERCFYFLQVAALEKQARAHTAAMEAAHAERQRHEARAGE